MKKLLLLIGFIGATLFTAQAQEFKPVKIGLGLGYASPGGDGAKGGVLVYFEPAYRVNDAIALGLRLELAAMARGVAFSSGGSTVSSEAEVKGNGSYTVNGQYYFSNNSFRPFVGLGLGIYTLASASVSSGGNTVEASGSGSEFGFYPRIGFDAGHFTLQAEYNIIPETESVVVSGGNTFTSTSKNSYIGIKAGFFISGGKR